MRALHIIDDLPQAERWAALAGCAQEGDKRAYAALLSEILPFIKMRISGRLSNPDWADDIAQEVLMSVHKSLCSYSPERPFKPWLNAIIQFRRTDFLRKHYKIKAIKETSRADSTIFEKDVTFQASTGELKDIEAAINSLPLKQQEIFKMMKIEGYSAKEVAVEMTMSVSAVKVSLHRATHKLRDMLH